MSTILLRENMPQKEYDYIIAGAGCAGLSLAMQLVKQKGLGQKKILLVDETEKTTNDRTWCFWEVEPGPFEEIVYRQWEHLWFCSDVFSDLLSIAPYRYKMIRGIDFYNHCFATLKQHANVRFLQGKVDELFSAETTGAVVNGKPITADYVFNSILFEKPILKEKEIWFLQHFKGWTIETESPAFTASRATLMDFRIPQNKGTAFCYVLPFSSTTALVEYTLFTPSLLQPDEYDDALRAYVSNHLKVKNYRVKETEFGVIPMTNHHFPKRQKNIVHIGTAGGQTKASSGYTFSFIQQHSRQMAESLVQNNHPFVAPAPKRFHFYDSVLLQVLEKNLVQGSTVFSLLFKKNNAKKVLAFLNNSSSFTDELQIISTLPTLPFAQAAMKQLF